MTQHIAQFYAAFLHSSGNAVIIVQDYHKSGELDIYRSFGVTKRVLYPDIYKRVHRGMRQKFMGQLSHLTVDDSRIASLLSESSSSSSRTAAANN